jgi:hypothetical protein
MVELQGVVPELKAGKTEIDGERAIPKWPETTADVKIPSVRSSQLPGSARPAASSQAAMPASLCLPPAEHPLQHSAVFES